MCSPILLPASIPVSQAWPMRHEFPPLLLLASSNSPSPFSFLRSFLFPLPILPPSFPSFFSVPPSRLYPVTPLRWPMLPRPYLRLLSWEYESQMLHCLRSLPSNPRFLRFAPILDSFLQWRLLAPLKSSKDCRQQKTPRSSPGHLPKKTCSASTSSKDSPPRR